jgi:hypothetical protein
MKVLFLFWHGLGDNVLATPAIRQYKEKTGNYIGWMMIERLLGAKLFDNTPYIDAIHGCSDAWHCMGHNNIFEGSKKVIEEAKIIKDKFGYDELIVIDHKSSKKHKIYRTAEEMGVTLDNDDLHTDFFYSKNNAIRMASNLNLPSKYVFFSGLTGVPKKNFPIEYVKDYMKKEDYQKIMIKQ